MTAHKLSAVNEISFDADVIAAGQRYLVEFSAPWCGACKILAPVIESVADELEGTLRVGVVDTEQSPSLGTRFNVTALPTLILFDGGKEIARHRGTLSKGALREMVAEGNGKG